MSFHLSSFPRWRDIYGSIPIIIFRNGALIIFGRFQFPLVALLRLRVSGTHLFSGPKTKKDPSNYMRIPEATRHTRSMTKGMWRLDWITSLLPSVPWNPKISSPCYDTRIYNKIELCIASHEYDTLRLAVDKDKGGGVRESSRQYD